ncbi:CoA transferase [Amycolatopsis sp. cg5]|uniref:CoA transferase n=1 Tax=Amycolatopsis sp. cg5 TaxID=3238802 RepID=UPI003525E4A8
MMPPAVDNAVDLSWAGPVDLPLHGEADVQAACGVMHVHGRRRGAPTRLGFDYCTLVARELARVGALAVHLAGARGLRLTRVSTSVAEAALLSVSQYLAAASAGEEPGRPGEGPPFVSAEGVRFELETLDTEVWQSFWTELGVPDAAIRDGWPPFVRRFATAVCALPGELRARTGTLPLQSIMDTAAATGMSLVRVADRPLTDVPAFTVTQLLVQRPPAASDGTMPLAGLRVLESARRVQGPLAGHLLRLLGASVLRIEPPGGDLARGEAPLAAGVSARFHALNHGKELVEIDLNTPAGRRTVLDIAVDADVFLHNWAPDRAAARGLDFSDLARRAPGLIYAHASGWGNALGPRPPVGTDYMAQAHSGFTSPTLMTVVDVFGGIVSAHGVVAGLLRRQKTGGGQLVESSLLSAAAQLNSQAQASVSAPSTPVCDDLRALAADPRFDRALSWDGCVLPRSPWRFS